MFACCLKGNLNREYHIYLAYIGSVTRSIHIQWDSTCIAIILITESSYQKDALENLETSL